jgi:hypothetical protein
MNYNPRPDFSTSAGVHADQNETQSLNSSTRGVDSSVRYGFALPLGTAQASYAVRYDQHEQKAMAAQSNVIGEGASLVGTTYVTLARPRVSTGSVAVINAARTQTFVEGSDYVLIQVGTETRLQRLVGGAILDGQDVLIDYAYDVGGTYAYNQFDQTLNLNWSLRNYVNAYVRYLDSAPRIVSGIPTSPLNPVQSSLVGVRADVPLNLRLEMVLGGMMERENRREIIAPYRREAEEVYAQAEDPFFGVGNYRVALRRTRVTYDNSPQNVNLHGYDIRYWARLRSGLDISANFTGETDTGGVLERRRTVTTGKAQWNYRKLKLSFDLGRTLETQGGYTRSRALVQMLARREF